MKTKEKEMSLKLRKEGLSIKKNSNRIKSFEGFRK